MLISLDKFLIIYFSPYNINSMYEVEKDNKLEQNVSTAKFYSNFYYEILSVYEALINQIVLFSANIGQKEATLYIYVCDCTYI